MGKSESIVQQEILLAAAKHGIRLMRNNRGAGKFVDEATGNESYVRFGLLNESKEMDKRIKSSDLIGIYPIAHTSVQGFNNVKPAEYGLHVYGVFIAVEVKKEGWKYTGTPREVAQKNFIDWVKSMGGLASFCQSVDDFLRLIGKA